ncbi:glycosyltransferase family 2 protein [Paracoccus beibuensis]|uniref:glycosyltransferase family 2 protein n=1 Tax=Paracoccus beibuensis TaxID=547602 RepID=UPI00223F88BD|nr:glycosyltransferase family 2 protein [Paracoccus beibuensis]
MANFQGASFLEQAMRSVLDQTYGRIELILADDASDDDSVPIARAIAQGDNRVRVLASEQNQGPAATRNRALDAARGDWIAIVDSDDLIHPQRLSRLLSAAQRQGADLVADDLVHFGAPEAQGGRTLLQPLAMDRPMIIDTAMFLRANSGDPNVPGLGYLKPLMSRRVLGRHRYDTRLQIGEDYDLILRILLDGARYVLLPDPLYAYRRHGSSISHRLSVDRMAAMLAAHRALPPMTDPAAQKAAAAVDRHLRRTLRYERLVRDIKARRIARMLPRMADPAMLRRLVDSLQDRRRRSAAQGAGPATGPVACEPMPDPAEAWASAPASSAAAIAAEASLGRTALPPDAPDWARWLDKAVR